MAAMGKCSQQQILDLLYEIQDGMDRMDAKLDENLALLRIINYEAELGLKQIAEARFRYQKASSR